MVMLTASPLCAQVPVFDEQSAFKFLEQQCSFGPRNPGSQGYSSCLEWFKEFFTNLADDLQIQPFESTEHLTGNTVKLHNIIAYFEGSGGQPLMLCAHWDTRVFADLDPDPLKRTSPIPGANDGASGVAVLMEIARIASENPPPRPLLIVLFDGEDMGRASYRDEFALGSKYWAQNPVPVVPSEAILLDMIGDADLEIPIEPFSEVNAPHLRAYLWELADMLDLPAFIDEIGPAVQDDHVRLHRVGIRAVNLIDFDYPSWHTMQDTPDKCSAESLGQVGTLLISFIYGMK